MERNVKNPNNLPEWLLRVQEQSWEPEILISGIVLFTLFQLPDKAELLGDYLMKFSLAIFSSGTVSLSIVAVLKIAIYWLIAGFSAHLLFRSLWVAFVGLSYVYPDGIKKDQLKYHKRYLRLISRKQNFELIINKLEALCSSMFALSFLLFMLMIGLLSLIFFLLIIVIPISIYSPDSAFFGYFDKVISILGLIYIFDFLTLGLLKRIPYVSKLYYPLYRVLSFITLSFLYRNLYFYFISNHSKLKIVGFILLFCTFSMLMNLSIRSRESVFSSLSLSGISSDNLLVYNEHYEDIASSNIIKKLRIESQVVKGSFLKVFIAHSTVNEEYRMKNTCLIPDTVAIDQVLTDENKLSCLNNFYKLGINDSLYESDYLFTYHPETEQPGLLAFLDISEIKKGRNILKLFYRNTDNTADSIPYIVQSYVEFYKTQ